MIVPILRPPLQAPAADVDVAIVGAGAAGIAAARACLAAGLEVALLESRDRVGGRAVTAGFAGHPVDLGAHWLHAGHVNPLVTLGPAIGAPVRRAPSGGQIFVDGRAPPRPMREQQGRAFDRTDRAIAIAARNATDTDIGSVVPPLGPWGRATEATFALVSGRPLDEVSVKDFPSEEFGNNYFVRGGYGAMVARLASGLPVALSCAVWRIDWSGRGVVLHTSHGRVTARAAIVTVPVPVLNAGAIAFTPALPNGVASAIGAFLPGVYEHVILNWPHAPLAGPDRLAKLVGRRESLGMMAWMDGAPFHYLELDYAAVASARGCDGARLARRARGFLQRQFGTRALDRLRILAVTDWLSDPHALSSWAVAPPGEHGARDALRQPVGERIWFAGEATSRAQWGTVGGAWEEGEAAASHVVAALERRRPGST